MNLAEVRGAADAILTQVRKAVVGQDEAIALLLNALFCGGHVLIEGVPGTAKTLLAQSFAASLALRFGRVQFTPDLMPCDLLGANLFNFQTNAFTLTQGPIFTDILLADEINRTPPKTQAALLQAMNERAATIDGVTHSLGDDFMVVATQNPIEQQGTYPLPEAQLDRFLFKIVIGYPQRDEERAIVARHGHRALMPRLQEFGLQAAMNPAALGEARALVETVKLESSLVDYIVDLIRATRENPNLETGASAARRDHARLRGPRPCRARGPRLRHSRRRESPRAAVAAPSARVVAGGGDLEGLSADQIARDVVAQVAAPR